MTIIKFEPQLDITAYELAQLLKCHTYAASGTAREMFDAMPDN